MDSMSHAFSHCHFLKAMLLTLFACALGLVSAVGCTDKTGSSGSRLPPEPAEKRVVLDVEAYRSYEGDAPLRGTILPPALDAKAPSASRHPASAMIDDDPETYWESDDDLDKLGWTLAFGSVDEDEDMLGFIVDTRCLKEDEYRAIRLLELSTHEEPKPEAFAALMEKSDIRIPGEELFIRNDGKVVLALENEAARQVFFFNATYDALTLTPHDYCRLVVEAKVLEWYPGDGDDTCLTEIRPFLQVREQPRSLSDE